MVDEIVIDLRTSERLEPVDLDAAAQQDRGAASGPVAAVAAAAPIAQVGRTSRRTGTFRSALRHRRFRWLIAGHAASSLGQTLGAVAVAGVLYARTGQIAWVTAAAAARLLPYILGSTLAGVLADRRDRQAVLIWSCVVRAVLVAGLAGGVAAAAPPALLVGLVFAMTLAGTPSYPAIAASIPALVPPGDLAPANGLLTTIETGAFMIGPAIGGLLLVVGSPALALGVNAAAFVLALALFVPAGSLPAASASEAPESLGGALAAGLRAITASGQVLAPMVLVISVNLVYGGSLVCLAAYAREQLGSGESGLGILTAALGAGALVGVLLANPLARAHRPMRAIVVSSLLAGLPFALLTVVHQAAAAAALLVVAGAASIVTEVLAVTVLQASLPTTVIARVFGVLDSLVIGAVLVGAALDAPHGRAPRARGRGAPDRRVPPDPALRGRLEPAAAEAGAPSCLDRRSGPRDTMRR